MNVIIHIDISACQCTASMAIKACIFLVIKTKSGRQNHNFTLLFPYLCSIRMASPLWPSPSSRATIKWFLSYWRMILKARSACPPCTLLRARMTPSQLPCSSRTTTMLTSSRRYAHSTVWLRKAGMCGSQPNVVGCVCDNVSMLWLWGGQCVSVALVNVPVLHLVILPNSEGNIEKSNFLDFNGFSILTLGLYPLYKYWMDLVYICY